MLQQSQPLVSPVERRVRTLMDLLGCWLFHTAKAGQFKIERFRSCITGLQVKEVIGISLSLGLRPGLGLRIAREELWVIDVARLHLGSTTATLAPTATGTTFLAADLVHAAALAALTPLGLSRGHNGRGDFFLLQQGNGLRGRMATQARRRGPQLLGPLELPGKRGLLVGLLEGRGEAQVALDALEDVFLCQGCTIPRISGRRERILVGGGH